MYNISINCNILPHLWWVLGYMAVAIVGAVFLFLRQMKKQ